MRSSDLDLRELLDFNPEGGVIRFAGQRALLFDAVAMGLLRQSLINTLGETGARGVLTRFGFAHGARTAETLKEAFPWDSERDWRTAGGRLHALQGLVVLEPRPRTPQDGPEPFAEAIWKESFEAEQHLLLLGRSESPVCWSLCGFASGYLSRVNGRPVYCLEERCVGKGDAYCLVVGRFKEDWGSEHAEQLRYFEMNCLNGALQGVTEQLKRTEGRLRARRQALARAEGSEDASGLVTRSESMKQVLELARRAAKVDSTVLVTGPSGAGKERVARLIHDESPFARGPFVAVSCAAMTETLLESELFGHVRGAFTGATTDRLGLFETAQGGTLFLDEIGEVSPALQAKLLRVLQEREIRRVGESQSRKVQVRVLAATHKDLAAEVAAGRFREDLYYRLRVISLKLPSLAERKEDILPLARTLLVDLSRRMGRPVHGLTPRAADQLMRYPWPGNVRELQNALERAVALCASQRVELEDLPEEIRAALPVAASGEGLADLERTHILSTLERNKGNRSRTAEALGIGPATLYRKLKQYGVSASRAG